MPPDRRAVAVLPHAAARATRARLGLPRRRRSRTRSTSGRAVLLRALARRHGRASSAPTRARTAPASRRSSTRRTSCSPTCSVRCASRGIRSRMARFGLPGAAAGDRALRAPAFAGPRARAPARRLRGALDPAARAAAHRGVRADVRAHRARRRLAGRARRLAARSPTRWRRTCASSAGASRPAAPCARSRDLPPARVVLFDTSAARSSSTSPATLLPAGYVARLGRYRYGPGVFKLDWALDGPIPWRDPRCLEASHRARRRHARRDRRRRGGGVARRAPRAAVRAASCSRASSTPRAPRPASTPARRTATCRRARRVDMTDAIERQIERFAPGFRDRILARHVLAPARPRALQRELRRRRHHRRRRRPDAALHPPGGAPRPVRDAEPAPLPVLGVDAARRRRARHVRLLRGEGRAPARLRRPTRLNVWNRRARDGLGDAFRDGELVHAAPIEPRAATVA